MPSVQRFIHALRALMEDEVPRSKKKARKTEPKRNSNRSRQAVALVITFRDLFANGGLNFLLEDIDTPRRPSKKYKNYSGHSTPSHFDGSTSSNVPANGQTQPLRGVNKSGLTSQGTSFLDDETTPLLMEERPALPPSILPPCSELNTALPLVPVNQVQPVPFIGKWSKTQTNFTVPLAPDDEDKTTKALRKVLKWSPNKQNLASFALTMPKEEKHKAVAVVQNAVNRVKEEQERKKKRKFFCLSFC